MKRRRKAFLDTVYGAKGMMRRKGAPLPYQVQYF